MRTFEIGKDRSGKDFFWLYLRKFDGIETDYTPMTKLTNEEAWALAKCNYCSLGYKEEPGPTNIDPKDLLVIKPVNIMSRWPEASPIISDQLVVTLPGNTNLGRAAIELIDPWYEDNPKYLNEHKSIQKFRASPEDSELEIQLINRHYPHQNVDPEPVRAIKYALEVFETDPYSAHLFLQAWLEGNTTEHWPGFETFQKLPHDYQRPFSAAEIQYENEQQG